MRLTLKTLAGYSDDLGWLADEAERQVTLALANRWQQVRGLDSEEYVPIMREEAASALISAENTYGVSSAALGHDMLSKTMGKDPPFGIDGLEVADEYKESQSARYWVKFLDGTDEGFESFLRGVTTRVRRKVTHAADREVALSSVRMGKSNKGIRFARVPSGPSCGFCIMLASRGFVYASRESAGEFTKFHDGCDCRIVAGMDGMEVEGYDPKGLYDRYARCVRAINGDTLSSSNGRVYEDWERLSDEERAAWGKEAKHGEDAFNKYFEHRVCREMDTRDREWIWSGKIRPVSYEGVSKAERRRMKANHETDGHSFMRSQGFNTDALPTYDNAVANIDMRLNGVLWELKTVKGNGGSLNRRFDEAVSKWERLHNAGQEANSSPRIVIDNRFGTMSDQDATSKITHNIHFFRQAEDRESIEEVLLITKDETLLRFS